MMSPGRVRRWMKKRGSWGLKQARKEISCRRLASRCLAVQNSLTNAGVSNETPLNEKAVARRRVGAPNSRNFSSSDTNECAEAWEGGAVGANGRSRTSGDTAFVIRAKAQH